MKGFPPIRNRVFEHENRFEERRESRRGEKEDEDLRVMLMLMMVQYKERERNERMNQCCCMFDVQVKCSFC